MDRNLPPDLICDFIDFFHSGKQMQNSIQQPKKAETRQIDTTERQKNESADKLSGTLFNYTLVTKKKPQVIQLDSSDDNDKVKVITSNQFKTVKKVPEKTKKIKKGIKCLLCKHQGKPSTMKKCDKCKNQYHKVCLGYDDKPVPKRVICDKCKNIKRQQQKLQKSIKKPQVKQMPLDKSIEKFVYKKTQKQKKKQEHSKKLNEFLQRYPYYQHEGKVKFPIDDRVLLIYKDLFDVSDNSKIFPIAHPIIPTHMLGDLMQIQNFFSTFSDQLDQGEYIDARKSVLYFTLNCNGPDKHFKLMFGCLLKIYLRDILQRNKTDNVKALNENCFFTLLINLSEYQELDCEFISKVGVQIIRFLSTIPSMKKAFQNFQFPDDLNLATKIYVLLSLIQGMSQVDSFHELVSKRSDKIQQMTKERSDLINKLKNDEAQVLSNKQKMRQINDAQTDRLKQQLQDQNQRPARRDKQADKNKKKLQKLTNEKQKSQQLIKQFRARVSEITKSISFITSEVILLGQDRNRSQYFFYVKQPHRLYVRYREFILTDKAQYLIYQGRQKIVEFAKTLNTKGIQQRHLSQNLNGLIKDNIVHNLTQQDQQVDCTAEFKLGDRIDFRDQVTIQGVIKAIREIQQSFSAYLLVKGLQWQAEAGRIQFVENLKTTYDIQQLKESLKQLQQSFLFVQKIQDTRQEEENSSQQQQQQDRPINPFMFGGGSIKKKVAIRIWGINSEKIKKFWIQYLETCIDAYGIWICISIFKNYVDKYVKRKMEHLVEAQKKNEKNEKQRERLRKNRQKQKQKQKMQSERSRSRSRDKKQKAKIKEYEISSEQKQSYPNLRKSARLHKKKLQIDSDYDEPSYQEPEEQSLSEDVCQVCGQYGQMICCDNCPKVYHPHCVGIKQIPSGSWVCIDCMQKIAKSRNTRSKTKKLNQLN